MLRDVVRDQRLVEGDRPSVVEWDGTAARWRRTNEWPSAHGSWTWLWLITRRLATWRPVGSRRCSVAGTAQGVVAAVAPSGQSEDQPYAGVVIGEGMICRKSRLR